MEKFSFIESPSFIESSSSSDRNLVTNNKSQPEDCNLIVNYLPQDIDDSQLQELFAEHGEIVQAKVVRDKSSKKSMGYGFVKYTNYEDAATAISQKNRCMIGSKVIKVSFARTSSEEIKNCKLYITNIPRAYMEIDVINLFSCFGNIIECRVLKDHAFGTSKGVAFVQFNLRSEANHALTLNGIRVEGSDRPLIVKYAEDQSRKNEESTKRHSQHNASPQDSYYPIPMDPHHLHANNLVKNIPTSTYTIPQIQAYLPAPSPITYTYGTPYKYVASPAQVISQSEWYQQQQQQHQLPINFLVPEVVRYPQQQQQHQQQNEILRQQQQLHVQSQFNTYQQLQTEQQSQQQLLYARQYEAQFQKTSKAKTNPLHLGYQQQQQQQQQQPLRKGLTNTKTPARDVMVTVKGIPSEADILSLHQFFSHYGTVLGLDVDVDEAHKARISSKRNSEPSPEKPVGYMSGIIKFSDIDSARLAIAELNSGNVLYNNAYQLQVELMH